MSMIINETLRLYPPAVATARKVKKETRLGKFTLPEGITMTVPVLSLHHDPKIWGEDAHLFKQERFSKRNCWSHKWKSISIPAIQPRTSNLCWLEFWYHGDQNLQSQWFFCAIPSSYLQTMSSQMINLKPQCGVQVLIHLLQWWTVIQVSYF